MADRTITGSTAITSDNVDDTDVLPIVDISEAAASDRNKKITIAEAKQLFNAEVFNVKNYGAVGDGVTDDSTAIGSAATAAAAVATDDIRPTIYFPAGDYHCGSILDFGHNVNVDASEATLNFTGTHSNAPFITVGDGLEETTGAFHKFNKIEYTGTDSAYPNNKFYDLNRDEFAGLRILNTQQSQIQVNTIRDFHTGLQLWCEEIGGTATDNLAVYENEVTFTNSFDNKWAVHIHSVDGFCNDNKINGGNWQNTSSTRDTVGGTQGVRYSHVDATGATPNGNSIYKPSTQTSSGQTWAEGYWATGQSATAGDQKWQTDVNGVDRAYIATTTGTTGATPPTHASGSVSDGTVTWLALEPYHRCVQMQVIDGASGSIQTNNIYDARVEGSTTPLMVVDGTAGTSTAPHNKIGITSYSPTVRTGYPSILGFDTTNEISVGVPFVEAFEQGYYGRDQYRLDAIHEKIIGSATGWTSNSDVVFARNNSGHPVDRTRASSGTKLCLDSIYVDFDMYVGVMFRTDASGGLTYDYSEFSGGVAPRASVVLYDETFTSVTEVVGEHPLSMISGSGAYSGSVYRLGDTGSSAWPREIRYEQDGKYVFPGMSIGHINHIIYDLVPGGTDDLVRERLIPVNPNGTTAETRCSNGVPTSGIFKTAGEFIQNLNFATDGIVGWKVQSTGHVAPAWASATANIKYKELRSNSEGRIYAAQSAGTTGATEPTGTGININDDNILWDYIGDVAVLAEQTEFNVKYFGATGDGVTDDSTAVQNCLDAAQGNTVYFPDGDYLLQDVQIPTQYGCKIIGGENVRILWSGAGSWSPLYYNIDGGTETSVTVTSVATEDDFPTADDQRKTEILGTFPTSSWTEGDIAKIVSNDTEIEGFIKSEWFEIIDVVNNTSIVTNRELDHSYNAGANTTIVIKPQWTPKVSIKGLSFAPSADVVTAPNGRRPGLMLFGAIDPEIDVHFEDVYNTAIQLRSVYRGKCHATWDDLFVDYSAVSEGYIFNVQGDCRYTLLSGEGRKAGHVVTMNGIGTTYVAGDWDHYGVPTDVVSRGFVVSNHRRSAFDCHWAYRPVFENLNIYGSAMDDLENNFNTYAFGVSAQDPIIRNITCRDVIGILTLTALSQESNYRLSNIDYVSSNPGNATAIKTEDNAIIHVDNSWIEQNNSPDGGYGVYASSTLSGTGSGFYIKNTTFKSSSAVYRVDASVTTPPITHFIDCTWIADSTATNRFALLQSAIDSGEFYIHGLTIVNEVGGAGDPDGLIDVSTGITAHVHIGRITHTGAMTLRADGILGTLIVHTLDDSKLFIGDEVAANATAICGEDLPVDSTAAARTITSPSTPNAGDRFGVADSRAQSAVNNITVDFGTDNFYGSVGDDTIDTNGAHIFYKYWNSTIGWTRD